jgi:hypothetical protein
MKILVLTTALAIAALTGAAAPASADPWKDESGHGRWRYEREGGFDGRDHRRERRFFERRAYGYDGERAGWRAYRHRPAHGYYRARPEPRVVYRYREVPADGYYYPY